MKLKGVEILMVTNRFKKQTCWVMTTTGPRTHAVSIQYDTKSHVFALSSDHFKYKLNPQLHHKHTRLSACLATKSKVPLKAWMEGYCQTILLLLQLCIRLRIFFCFLKFFSLFRSFPFSFPFSLNFFSLSNHFILSYVFFLSLIPSLSASNLD